MGLLADIRSKPAEPGAQAGTAAAASAAAAPPPVPAATVQAASAAATPSTTSAALPLMPSPLPSQPAAAALDPAQVRLAHQVTFNLSGGVHLLASSSEDRQQRPPIT